MVALKSSFVALATLLATAYAAPTDLAVLDKRATVLADGSKVVVGSLPDWSLIFRASGYLAKGGCPASVGITTCYVQKLSAKATENLDPDLSSDGSSQSNFISTAALEATGAVTKFTFKFFLDPALTTPSSSPVPIVQVVSKEPVDGQGSATKVWFDVKDNKAGVYAFSDAVPVVSVPLSSFTGRTTLQTWTIKGGPQGYVDIDLKDSETGAFIFQYRVNQASTVDSYRLRVGPIRLASSGSPYTAYFGDWSAQAL